MTSSTICPGILCIDFDCTATYENSGVAYDDLKGEYGLARTDRVADLLVAIEQQEDLVTSYAEAVKFLEKKVVSKIRVAPDFIWFINVALRRNYKIAITSLNRGCNIPLVGTPREVESGESFIREFLRFNGVNEENLAKIVVVAGYTGCSDLAINGKNGHVARVKRVFGFVGDAVCPPIAVIDDNWSNVVSALHAGFSSIWVPAFVEHERFWFETMNLLDGAKLFIPAQVDERRKVFVSPISNLGFAVKHQQILNMCDVRCVNWQHVGIAGDYCQYVCPVTEELLSSAADSFRQLFDRRCTKLLADKNSCLIPRPVVVKLDVESQNNFALQFSKVSDANCMEFFCAQAQTVLEQFKPEMEFKLVKSRQDDDYFITGFSCSAAAKMVLRLLDEAWRDALADALRRAITVGSYPGLPRVLVITYDIKTFRSDQLLHKALTCSLANHSGSVWRSGLDVPPTSRDDKVAGGPVCLEPLF